MGILFGEYTSGNVVIDQYRMLARVGRNGLNLPFGRLRNNMTDPPKRRAIGDSDFPLHTGGYHKEGQKLMPTTNFFEQNMSIENVKNTTYLKGMESTRCIANITSFYIFKP